MKYINVQDPKRFILEKYRSGGVNRHECPQCHRRKCFTYYINLETGEILDPTCGKCNHENSCGYHYTPRQLFHDRPDIKQRVLYDNQLADSSCVLSPRLKTYETVVRTPPFEQTLFFPSHWPTETAKRPCTFKTYMREVVAQKLGIDPEVIDCVMDQYYVGGTKEDAIGYGGINYGPSAIFWRVDNQQRVHDGKMMAYTSDGHRAPRVDWVRSICARLHEQAKNDPGKAERLRNVPLIQQTEKSLFGLHLLDLYPQKPVCIVEGEKTAVICACKYTDYIWMATGGCGLLNAQCIAPLSQRKLIVIPDSGELAKWSRIMAQTKHPDYIMLDIIEPYQPNTDLADLILGDAQLQQ